MQQLYALLIFNFFQSNLCKAAAFNCAAMSDHIRSIFPIPFSLVVATCTWHEKKKTKQKILIMRLTGPTFPWHGERFCGLQTYADLSATFRRWKGRKLGVARCEMSTCQTPHAISAVPDPTEARSFRMSREPVRRTPMGYPRSLPRENYPRARCEIIPEGVDAEGPAERMQKKKYKFQREDSSESDVGERRSVSSLRKKSGKIFIPELKDPYSHPLCRTQSPSLGLSSSPWTFSNYARNLLARCKR